MADFDPSTAVPAIRGAKSGWSNDPAQRGKQLNSAWDDAVHFGEASVLRPLAPLGTAMAAGGALGLAGGPFSGITVPAGALGGAAVYGGSKLLDLFSMAGNAGGNQIAKGLGYAGDSEPILPGSSYDQAINAGLDYFNVPRPETPAERITSSALGAVADSAGGFGLGTKLIRGATPAAQAVGRFLTAGSETPVGMGKNAVAAATSGGAAEIAHEIAPESKVAPFIGAMSPFAAAGAANLGRAALRGSFDPTKTREVVDLFRTMNTTPTVGQATGSPVARFLEAATGHLPGGNIVLANKGAEQAAGIQGRVLEHADLLDPRATATSAGQKALQGVTETFIPGKRAVQSDLYNRLDTFIPPDAPVATSNFGASLDKLTTPVAGANGLENAKLLAAHPDIAELNDLYKAAASAGSGNLSFGALKEIRSRIGEKLSDFSLSSDKPTAQLKQLYGALSDDMRAAAAAAGPEAQSAFNRANNYTRALNSRIDILQSAVDKAGGPEKIFEAATNPGTIKFGASNLNALMKSLPDDAKRTFASAFIRERLGRPNPGIQNAEGTAFSTESFLTNWSKMSPEAKRALFGQFGQGYVDNMNRIVKATSVRRDGSRTLVNTSGTTASMMGAGAVGTLTSGIFTGNPTLIGSALGLGAAGVVGAKFFTNPGVVKFLANNTKVSVGNAIPQIDRYIQMSRKKGDEETASAFEALKGQVTRDPVHDDGFDPNSATEVHSDGFDPSKATPASRAKQLLAE